MEVTVLGGAAAAPNPGQGCAGFLIRSADDAVVLDLGPDTLSVLRQHIDYRAVSAVVISHLHSDHTLDLVPYRYGLKYGPGSPSSRIPLWLPPAGLDFLAAFAGVFAMGEDAPSFFASVFAPCEYDPSSVLDACGLQIQFQETRHAIPCWAMRLEAAGSVLAYTADTASGPEIAGLARDADLLIAEATMPEGVDMGPRPTHLTAGQAGKIAAEAGAKRLMLTHYWDELGPQTLLGEARAHFSGEVLLARPGLRVQV